MLVLQRNNNLKKIKIIVYQKLVNSKKKINKLYILSKINNINNSYNLCHFFSLNAFLSSK